MKIKIQETYLLKCLERFKQKFIGFNVLLLILVLCVSKTSLAQNISISGFVKNAQDSLPITGTSVVLKANNTFLGYAYSDEAGAFNINVEAIYKQFVLEVSALGFKRYKDSLIVMDNENVSRNVYLSEKIETLSTVVLKSTEKIEVNRDTISYRLSAFEDGIENSVEDMLKNLPGIEVDDNGIIRALGEPIDKILIEGDDLANSNYKVISQNLDPSALKSIEIIQNYEENPVLKQFLNSSAVVLNLKLKEDKKSMLFGKADVGLGLENRYSGDLNLAFINPNFKLLNLGFVNNIGRTAGAQFSNYEFSIGGFNDFKKSYKLNQNPMVYLQGSIMDIDEKYYVENQALSNSLLFNKKFSKTLHIKNTLYTYRDNFKKDYNIGYTYFVPPNTISYSEHNNFENTDFSIGNDFELQSNPSASSNLIISASFVYKNKNDMNDLVTNGNLINQTLKSKINNFDAQVQYTKKLNNGALVLDGFSGVKSNDELFTIHPNAFAQDSTNSELNTNYKSSLKYWGAESAFVFKSGKTSHSYTIGVLHTSENIKGQSYANKLVIDSLSGSDNAKKLEPKAQVKLKLPMGERLEFNAIAEGKISFYKRNNTSSSFFLPNADFNIQLKEGKTGNYRVGWEYVSKLETLDYYVDFFIVNSYRSLSLGANRVEAIINNRYYFRHSFSNVKKRLFFSTSLSYKHFNSQFVQEGLLNQDFNISRSVYTSGQNFIFFNTSVATYSKPLNMSLKVGYNYSRVINPSVVNNTFLETVNNTSGFGLTGTSYFRSFFNFKFQMNYTDNKGWNTESEVRNRRFQFMFNPIFKINSEWIINAKFKNYLVDSIFYDANYMEIIYEPELKKWSLGLYVQNIFNKETFEFNYLNNYTNTNISYKTVPRYAYVYWRFKF
ncbi:TonB-dependent receptor [Formosa algae]|uniref:TonB-dependent receptor n=1 Tax=Formosa algae TaxID=225843 RepID=UPI0011AFB2D2|nr:hypothetical protein [Formosa algae]